MPGPVIGIRKGQARFPRPGILKKRQIIYRVHK